MVTKGRIVLFYAQDGEELVALVVKAFEDPGIVNLWVFDDGTHAGEAGLRVGVKAQDRNVKQPMTWHWPPRE